MDEAKNDLNIRKHSIDFVDVPELFRYPMLTFQDTRLDYGEERWIGVGILRSVVVVVVYTDRGDNLLRIISARKATKSETNRYVQHFKD